VSICGSNICANREVSSCSICLLERPPPSIAWNILYFKTKEVSTNNIAIGSVRVRKIRFQPTQNTLSCPTARNVFCSFTQPYREEASERRSKDEVAALPPDPAAPTTPCLPRLASPLHGEPAAVSNNFSSGHVRDGGAHTNGQTHADIRAAADEKSLKHTEQSELRQSLTS
jgi:hypothetical protein